MSEDIRQKIIELLRTVYDPEIPINVYDLGLVYSINVADDSIEVVLGLTTPFCPVAYFIVYQVESLLKQHFRDKKINVRLDLERFWTPERMTEEGRKLFKILYGYDILEKR